MFKFCQYIKRWLAISLAGVSLGITPLAVPAHGWWGRDHGGYYHHYYPYPRYPYPLYPYPRYPYPYYHHYYHEDSWLGSAIIGGTVAGLVNRALTPAPVYYDPPAVIYREPTTIIYEGVPPPPVTPIVEPKRVVIDDAAPQTRFIRDDGYPP